MYSIELGLSLFVFFCLFLLFYLHLVKLQERIALYIMCLPDINNFVLHLSSGMTLFLLFFFDESPFSYFSMVLLIEKMLFVQECFVDTKFTRMPQKKK